MKLTSQLSLVNGAELLQPDRDPAHSARPIGSLTIDVGSIRPMSDKTTETGRRSLRNEEKKERLAEQEIRRGLRETRDHPGTTHRAIETTHRLTGRAEPAPGTTHRLQKGIVDIAMSVVNRRKMRRQRVEMKDHTGRTEPEIEQMMTLVTTTHEALKTTQ